MYSVIINMGAEVWKEVRKKSKKKQKAGEIGNVKGRSQWEGDFRVVANQIDCEEKNKRKMTLFWQLGLTNMGKNS